MKSELVLLPFIGTASLGFDQTLARSTVEKKTPLVFIDLL